MRWHTMYIMEEDYEAPGTVSTPRLLCTMQAMLNVNQETHMRSTSI